MGQAPFEILYGQRCSTWVKMRLALVGRKQDSEGDEGALIGSGDGEHGWVPETTGGNRRVVRAQADKTGFHSALV